MKSIRAVVQAIVLACVALQAQAATPAANEEPVLLQGLLPASRDAVRAAARADALPDSADLARAQALYSRWIGAWLPSHAKPTSEDRREVETFTASLQSRLPALSEQARLDQPNLDADTFTRILVIGSPDFEAHRQTTDTQSIKALALMGLVEHELDIKEGARIAMALLPKLSQRTPLDADIEMFYAKLALDARRGPEAWRAARTGLLLKAAPSDIDLDFAGYVGAAVDKSQWPQVQEMLRAVATSPAQADAAISRMAVLFTDRAGTSWIPRGGTLPASAPAH
jgi:hypothetical protein